MEWWVGVRARTVSIAKKMTASFTPSVEERRGRTAAVSRHDGVVWGEAAGGGEEGVEYDEEEQIGEGW